MARHAHLWTFFLLASLLLLSEAWAAQSAGQLIGVTLKRNPNPTAWEIFQTDANVRGTYTLGQGSGGAQILTPGVNSADLPNSVLICPGTLSLGATPDAKWSVNSFAGQSSILPQTNPPVPAGAWAPPGMNFPVQWNTPALVTCSNGNMAELLTCMGLTGFSVLNVGEWANVLTGGQNVNVLYAPTLGPPPPTIYDCPAGKNNLNNKCQAEGALVCNAVFSVNGNTQRVVGGTSTFGLNFPNPGTSTVTSFLDLQTCDGVVHKLPEQNNANSRKYYYKFDSGSQFSLVKNNKATFTVNVATPTTCNGQLVSVNPSSLTNVAPGSSVTVKITVNNPQTGNGATYIKATGVSANNNWGAAPATQPPPNGFNVDIAPGANQDLLVTLTAPTPVSSPVQLTITFQSSTPLCNNQVCTSNLPVTIQVVGCGCTVAQTAGPPATGLKPGDDIEMTAACQCNGQAVSCPQLTWTAQGFVNNDVSVKDKAEYQANGKYSPPPPNYQLTDTTPPEPPLPQAEFITYDGTVPPWKTVPPENGNVQVSGTLQGQPFTCQLPGGNNGIQIVPNCGCSLTTDSQSNNNLLPGDDLTLTAACQCNGQTLNCPALAWTTAFSKVDLKPAPGTPKRANDPPPGPPYQTTANTPAAPPQEQAILQTFKWTPVPQSGNVQAAGTLQGVPISCQVPGNNPITIGNLPDLIPVITFVPSAQVAKGATVQVRVHTRNQGGSPVTVSSNTRTYLPLGNKVMDETVTPPLAAGANTNDQVYSYTCPNFATLIPVESVADEDKKVAESNEANNDQKRFINCGGALVCYDYV